jgi:hypothetical protein
MPYTEVSKDEPVEQKRRENNFLYDDFQRKKSRFDKAVLPKRRRPLASHRGFDILSHP